MKITHTFFGLIVLSILFTGSCSSSKEETDKIQIGNYQAVVVDSLTFEWLPEVKLLDYNDETEELLLASQREILIIDKEGNIVSQFNPHIEGPNYVGDFDFGWIFYGDGQLMCYGSYYFHLFSKVGERIKRVPYPVETNGLYLLDGDPQMLMTYSTEGQDKLVTFITAPMGPHFKTKDFQDSVQMVYLMDVNSELGTPIMHKPENSVYRTLGKYVDRGWPHMTSLGEGIIAQTYSIDSVLYIWNADSNELVNSIPIPAEHRPEYETIDFEQKGEPDRVKTNGYIHSTGDKIILTSVSRIPESVRAELEKQPRYRESDAFKEASKKYNKVRSLLFDKDRYLGPLSFKIGKYEYNRIGTKSGFMWFQRRYDDERDYRTFLKVRVEEENISAN